MDSYPVVSGKSYLIWIAIQIYAGFLSTNLWITIQLKNGWRARLRMNIQIQPEGYPLDRNPVPTGGTGAIRLELDWCPKCFYSWIGIHIVAYFYPVLHRMQCCTGCSAVTDAALYRKQHCTGCSAAQDAALCDIQGCIEYRQAVAVLYMYNIIALQCTRICTLPNTGAVHISILRLINCENTKKDTGTCVLYIISPLQWKAWFLLTFILEPGTED